MRIEIDQKQFERGALNALASGLNDIVNAQIPSVRRSCQDIARKRLLESPEYESLTGGRLWHELGVVDKDRIAKEIADRICDGITVKNNGVRVVSSAVNGLVTIGFIKSGYEDLLSIPGASFVSENGFTVDWLEWLLTAGSDYVVAGYSFASGFNRRSRTGDGVMVNKSMWRVPGEFSGVSGENWLTRALEKIEDELVKELEKIFA